MTEFDTFEKARELFNKFGFENNDGRYFILFRDYTKNTGMGAAMDFPADAVLVSETAEGFAMILLVTDGVVLNLVNIEKLHTNDMKLFIGRNEISNVTIKKYSLFSSSMKRVSITAGNKKYNFYARVNEPKLPYHNANYAFFESEFYKK